MSEYTFDVTCQRDNPFWQNLQKNQFDSVDNAFYDQSFDDISNIVQEDLPSNIKVKIKHKKRRSKFKRETDDQEARDKRDIKKYAKLDTSNLIFQKFTNKQGNEYQQVQNLLKKYKVSKRSLRCFFLTIGVLKKQGQLLRYWRFFKQNVQDIMKIKYQHRSQYFKKHLSKALDYNQKAIQYFLQNQDQFGIEVSYNQNLKGQKGKTKNPIQVEKCKSLYFSIFPSDLRSNIADLDIYLNCLEGNF